MSFLLKSINSVNETFRKAGSFNSDIGMFSGFTPLDILSSNFEHLDLNDIEVLNGGMFHNPYTEVGLSAVGKTTLWIQVISACMDNWYRYFGPVSECIFYNVENHTSPKRWKDVTGYTDEMMCERVRFVSKPYTIIEIYNELAILAKEKIKHKKELEIDTGYKSIDGGTIKILPTTYVLIDSIAAIRSKTELEYDKEGNVKSTDSVAGTSNMDAMQIAKDNTMFINEVKKLCEEAKICIVMINHLVEVPVLDRYNPPKPILPGMKFNQKLKGGNELVYQSFGVGMLSIRERMFNEKQKVYGEGVHGLVALMDWLKNKNGPEGVRYPMVFDSATGYKPELGDFEILYEEGQYGLQGSPMNYHLAILPEVSFTKKTLLEKCHQNPLLARALSFTTRYLLIQKVMLHKNPEPMDALSLLPYDARVDLILQHSMDYPGYINHGWIVDDELIEYNRMISEQTHRPNTYNMNLTEDEVNFIIATDGEYMLDHEELGINNGKEMKIGDTEFICGNDW